MKIKIILTVFLVFITSNLSAQNNSPSDYFPLNIGNHWKFHFLGDSLYSERWVYVDVIDTITFGIPGEILSYRVEISEQEISAPDTHIYHVDYFSFNSSGDLCLTSRGPADTLILFDSANVYIKNPISVGDSTYREGNFQGMNYKEITKIISLNDTLHLTLGYFEDCLHINEKFYINDVLHQETDRYFIPKSYFPIAGYGRLYKNANLVECNIYLPTHVQSSSKYNVKSFILNQNYPNPFNPTTTIKYFLQKERFVILKIFNVLGEEIESLVNENQLAGEYSINWNANSFNSGVYIYRLQAGEFVDTKKLILIK